MAKQVSSLKDLPGNYIELAKDKNPFSEKRIREVTKDCEFFALVINGDTYYILGNKKS